MKNNYDSVVSCNSSGTPHSQKQESTSYTATKRNWLSFVTVLVTLFCFMQSNAQVTTNGGSGLALTYATLADAITALNAATISAPVEITLAGAETAPVGGYSITATGTSANPIIIQGGNYVITAPAQTAAALNDAIFKIIGGDWITIQNFTMNERAFMPVAADTTAATNTMTEWGVALLYATTTNGAQNCTIQNNTIALNRTYQNTFGIYSNSTHTAVAPTTSATATSVTGGNSGLKVYGNTISNVNMGIIVVGPTAAADVNTGIDIGGASSATGNTISNFGTTVTFSGYANVSGTLNGILVRNSNGFNISYNSITSSNGGVIATGTLRGIFIPAASTTTTGTFVNSINNNTIALTHGFTTGTIQGVTIEASGTATSTQNINNNNFTAFGTSAASTSGAITAISCSYTAVTSNINNNTFTNITANTTGSFTFISHSVTNSTGGSQTVSGNSIVTGFNKTGAGSTVTCLINSLGSSPSGTTTTYNNNNFSNITVTGATGITGISSADYATSAVSIPTKIITNNTFNSWIGGTSAYTGVTSSQWAGNSTVNTNTFTNWSGQGAITAISLGSTGSIATSINIANNIINNLASTGTGGQVLGISCANTSTVININGNAINTLSTSGASSAVGGILITGATTTNVYSNTIYGMVSSSATAPLVLGISIQGGTTVNAYQNKMYNLSATVASSPSVYGFNITSGTNVNAYNNIIGGLTAPTASGTDVIRGISISSTATGSIKVYYNTIRLNATSTGANFGSSGIFHTLSATATIASLDLRNNIIVNASTANGTGSAVAFRRSANTSLNNYATSSNNNLFYGTTALYNDGANFATLAAFQTLVSTRETASKFQNPTFASTLGSDATFLHFASGATNLAGSYGQAIVGWGTDFDNEARDPSTPDIGADEWTNGLIVAPTVTSFTPTVLCLNGGQSITFTGTGFDTVTSILFNGSTGVNLPGVITASTATTLTVTIPVGVVDGGVIITNPAGTVDTTSTANVFTTVGAPTIGATAAAATICAGASTTLTGTGGVSYSWFPGTGLSATTGLSVTASPTVTTTYTVTGVSAEGCSSTGTVTITVLPAASAITITKNPASICEGGITTLTAAGGTVNSNASTYSLASSSGTYTPLAGSTAVASVNADGGMSTAIPLGFSFVYAGNTYTNVYASSNGFISFNSLAGTSNGNGIATAAASMLPLISPLWDDLDGSTGAASYLTSGTVGSRIFTFEWLNWKWNWLASGSSISFQVKLYEADGKIEFVYRADSGTLNSPSASVGLGGTTTGNFLSLNDLSTNPTTSTSTETTSISVKPATGQVYTFTRPLQPVLLWTPATNLFTDAAANVPYAGESTAVVYTKLTTPNTYTLTSTLGTCPVSNTVTVTPNLLPTITLGTAAPVCLGGTSSSLSFTATTDAPNQYTIDFDSAANTAGFADINTFTAFTSSPIALTVPAGAAAGTYNGTILVKNSTTGCVSATQQAFSITINTPVAITTQPSNSVSLVNSNASFTVAATGSGLTYQWQESTDNGVTWTNISAATSATYTAVSVTNGMNGNKYQCIVSGAAPCTSVTSSVVSLTISTTAITSQPTSTTICSNGSATFTIATTGSTPTYQWQVSADTGATWTDISGETNTSLTVSSLTSANSLQRYRCVLSPGPINSDVAILTIYDAVAITTQPADVTVCSTATNATFTAVATGTGLTYQWQQRASSGTWANVGTGTTGGTTATLTVTPITLGLDGYQYQCIVTGTAPCAPVTTATATLSVTGFIVGSSVPSVCIGGSFALAASTTASTPTLTYSWECATVGSGATTPVVGNPATITPTQAGTYVYTLTATGAGCTIVTTKTMVVNPLPVITTATATPNIACAGSTINLGAVINQIAPGNSAASGTGTSYTSSSDYPTFFGNYWYQDWSQMVYTAAELQAMGLSAGNITSLSFNMGALPDATTISQYSISLGSTTNSTLAAFQTNGLTTVLGPVTYTVPAVGNVTINFTTPYVWDGTSNIIVDVRGKGGFGNANATIQYTTTGNTVVFANSGFTSNTNFWTSNPTATTSTSRPNIKFGGQVLTNTTSAHTWTWSDGTSNVFSTATGSVVLPGTTTTYTVTATNIATGCSASQNVVVTSNPLPTAPTATNSSQCGTQVPTASVVDTNSFTGHTFKWYDVPTGGTALQSTTSATYSTAISATTTFYVSVVNPTTGCESPRTAVTVTVSTPDAITANANYTTICLGNSVILTAANSATTPVQTYAYSWLSSATSGVATAQTGASITATPTAAGTYTFTAFAVDGSCSTTATVIVTVNPLPAITTATASPTVACAGSTINLEATLNGISAGTSAPSGTGTTFTSSTGYPTLFGNYWYQDWSQMVYTAAELQAMGLSAGNITSLTFNMGALPDATTISGYSISLGATSNSVLTGFETAGLTTVLGPVTYTVPAIGNVTINFTTPYVWDGTSNIIVDIRGTGGYGGANGTLQYTATTGNNTVVFANSGFTNTPNFWTSNPTATTSTSRPNVKFGGQVIANVASSYTWTWKVGTSTVLSTATGTAVVPTPVSPATSVVYTVTATNPATGCSASQNVTVSTAVAPLYMFGVQPQASSICIGDSVTMYSNPTGGCIPYTYSWSDGTSVVGTAASLAVTPTSDKTYTLTITDNAGTQLINVATVTVNNPQPTSVLGQTICANSAAFTLSATESTVGNLLNWYAAPTGGSALASGASFTTPAISATTTYYVEENALGTANTGLGRASTTSVSSTTPSTYGLVFNLNVKTKLNTVDVYLASATAGNLVVQLQNSTGAVINSKTIAVPAGNATTPVQYTVPLDFIIPAGTGYRLLAISGPSMVRESALGGFPYSLSYFGDITSGYISGTSTSYYFFYNWSLSDICTGVRVPVTATLNIPTPITLSATTAAICNGQTTTTPVTVATGGSGYDVFTWSPSLGAPASGATSWTFNPTSTTTYTLTASQSAGTCSTTATYTVTVNPLPSALIITPSTLGQCVNQTQSLVVTGGNVGVSGKVGAGTLTNTASTPFRGFYGGSKTQALYTAAELTALGMEAGQKINSIGWVALSGTPLVLNDFTVKIGFVSSTALGSNFIAGANTVVVAPAPYTPTTGTGNIDFTVSPGLAWDGTSSLLVETCFNNNNGGGSSANSISVESSTVASGLNLYRSQDSTVDVCTNTTAPTTTTTRPNLSISTLETATTTWTPATNLFIDSAASIPYTLGGNATTVYVKSATPVSTTYTVTSTSAAGCSNNTTVSVTIDAFPTVVTSNPTAVCAPATVDLTVAAVTNGSSAGLTLSYWTDANATNPLTTASAVTTSGLYYIKGANANGCFVITPVTVTVNPVPALTITNPATVCSPATVDITSSSVITSATSGLTLSYWVDSAATTTALTSPNAVTTSGTYYVKAVNANGCSSIMPVTVTVNVTNAPTASAQTVCGSGTVANLLATGLGLQWYSNLTGGSALTISTPLATGTYFVSQTINGCESPRTSVSVTVSSPVTPTGATTQTINGGVAADVTIEDITVAGTNVIWYPTSGDATAGTNAIAALTQLVDGTTYYAVSVVGTCRSSVLAVTVTVVLEKESFDIKSLKFYPNPVIDILTISYSSEITSVQVYDISGRQIRNMSPNSNLVTVDLSDLATSVYVVKVFANDASSEFKVVKK